MANNYRSEVYLKYLESAHWKSLRQEKLNTQPECQHCKKKHHLEVHHIRYRKLTDCCSQDLAVLCHGCHKYFHGALKTWGGRTSDFEIDQIRETIERFKVFGFSMPMESEPRSKQQQKKEKIQSGLTRKERKRIARLEKLEKELKSEKTRKPKESNIKEVRLAIEHYWATERNIENVMVLRNHLSGILERSGVESRVDLTALVLNHNAVNEDDPF